MKKIFCVLIVLLITLQYIGINYAQTLNIAPGCSYILIDSKTGQVIAEQNADVKVRPASTTKIMTAIVALESGKLDQPMKVSEAAVDDIGPGGMNIGIMQDEEGFTLENLLNVMLIKSANETANIVAENIGTTREDFINKMNQKAAELGAVNTHYVNPCGKDNLKAEAEHLSTARDMATIGRYAMTLPKLREIVKKEYYYDLPATNKHDKWDPLRTTNKLLWPTNNYPYTIGDTENHYVVQGIKTGFTNAAGNNLISSAVNENGLELIAAVMHVTEGNNKVFTYTKNLFRYGFEQYSNQKIVDANVFIKNVKVEEAKKQETLNLVTASELSSALPIDMNEWNIERKEHIDLPVKAPVKQGAVLGYVEYQRNGISLGKVNIIASKTVDIATKGIMAEKAKNVMTKLPFKIIGGILLVSVLFILLRTYLRYLSRRVKLRKKF